MNAYAPDEWIAAHKCTHTHAVEYKLHKCLKITFHKVIQLTTRTLLSWALIGTRGKGGW